MDLKVGDFGLSIELESTDQCFNFEADVWSIGVIMYMMIFGISPFGGADRSMMINQILNDFPDNTGVSNEAMDLIYLILNPEYDARLTIPEIRHHLFFNGTLHRDYQPLL
ncbi:hypothetical protein Glove_226g9 [Diversispora epigaea]|uniref:Protein kinase domain-containing protein n=1 Tax=Diversispora epigaea TaxID=1348612 RepID=A0A397IEZ5_9GLOM|nr:hypothetical protein Glove_226g9 [Diversispora epigaea]